MSICFKIFGTRGCGSGVLINKAVVILELSVAVCVINDLIHAIVDEICVHEAPLYSR